MAVACGAFDVQMPIPRWPDRRSLRADRVRLTYDRPSDTLFVDRFGDSRPAASIPLDRGDRDDLYLRIDAATGDGVGLQIERVVSYAVRLRPELADALAIADLEGIDAAGVAALLEGIRAPRSARPDREAVIANPIRLTT